MSRPSWIKAVLLLGVVFGVTFVVGVDSVHCLLLAVGTLVVVQLRRLPEAEDREWPEREPGPSDQGVRLEVARLSWGLNGFESRVDRRSVDRLHAIAARRLRAHGVDLDDPADADRAEQLLGTAPYAALTSDLTTLPRYDAFAGAVAAVEHLPAAWPPDVRRSAPTR
ncbi:hypothetical protein [uncultured Friedmanniella sp.]|uniref:hypothetical protein n=1 Tax=uncultured Friedmanniella sp. TaxID=335381 RepID=UPI0035CA20FF